MLLCRQHHWDREESQARARNSADRVARFERAGRGFESLLAHRDTRGDKDGHPDSARRSRRASNRVSLAGVSSEVERHL